LTFLAQPSRPRRPDACVVTIWLPSVLTILGRSAASGPNRSPRHYSEERRSMRDPFRLGVPLHAMTVVAIMLGLAACSGGKRPPETTPKPQNKDMAPTAP